MDDKGFMMITAFFLLYTNKIYIYVDTLCHKVKDCPVFLHKQVECRSTLHSRRIAFGSSRY